MKLITHRPALIVLFALFAAVPLRAESPERTVQSSFGLDAQLAANKAGAEDHFKSGYGSSDIHTAKSRTIGVQVRNLGRTPAKAQLTVYWIGKFTGTNNRVVLAEQTDPLTVAPGAVQNISSSSGEVKGSDLKLVLARYRHTQGFTLDGWACVLRDDDTEPPHLRGALLAVKASDTHLDELVRLRETLAALPRVKDGRVLKAK